MQSTKNQKNGENVCNRESTKNEGNICKKEVIVLWFYKCYSNIEIRIKYLLYGNT